jgi:hypothetical protein
MKKNLKELSVLFFISIIIFFGFYRRLSPSPYLTNWDLLHHTTLIKQLLQGNFNIFLTSISDTFTINSYTPLFHMIMALIIAIFKLDILKFFWVAEFFYYLFTTFVSYYIGNKLTDSPWGGFITGLVSTLIFEATAAYTTLFLLPLTLAGTLTAFFWTYFITSKKNSVVYAFMSSLFIFALHYMIGGVYLAGLIYIFITKKFNSKNINNIFIFGSLIFMLTSIIFNFFGQKISILSRPDAQHFVYSLESFKALFWQWYGILPILLFPLGLIVYQKNHELGNIISTIFFFVTGLILFPMSYSLKLFAINHYLVSLFIAVGIIKLLFLIENKILKLILFILIFTALLSVFIANVNQHLSLSYNGKQNSYISDSDFKTATWIDNYYFGKKVFLVSDPTTQGIFEAITNVNTQGGAFPKVETVKILDTIKKVTDSKKISSSLKKINDSISNQNYRDVTLVVLGGRYFDWQKSDWDCKISYACQSWLPLSIKPSDKKYIKTISDSIYLKPVYQDQENTVLELSN